MKKLDTNIVKTSGTYMRGWAVVVVSIIILVAIVTNIGRVMVNASQNYQVYLSEKEVLDGLEEEYNQLEKELAYYRSYDYKKLYARDQLNIVEPGQKLYQINQNENFYEVVDRQRDIVKNDEYLDWWVTILLPGIR